MTQKFKPTVTLWDLLIWAYRDQRVGYATRDDVRLGYGKSATAVACRRLQVGTKIDGCGPFGASLRVHPDAERVHGVVRDLSLNDYNFLLDLAEAGEAPALDIKYIPARIAPVLRRNGKPKMIYDKNGNFFACEVKKVGINPHELDHLTDRKRAEYTRFVGLLEVIEGYLSTVPLEGRTVQGLGVVRVPWMAKVASRRPRNKILV